MNQVFDQPAKSSAEELSHQQLLNKINYDASGLVNLYRFIGFVIVLAGLIGMLIILGRVEEAYPDGNFILSTLGWYLGIGGILTGLGWIAVAQLIAGQERILAALLKDR
ncbi:MAG: hypothetical protein PHI18_04710 [bacterium]|nr:hypothetical protein [bacterium]